MAKKRSRAKAKRRDAPPAARPDEQQVASDLPDREVMTLIDTPLIGGELLSGTTGTDPLAAGAGTAGPATTESAQLASGGVEAVSQTTADAATIASQQAEAVQDVADDAPAQPYQPSQTSVSRT